MSDNLLTIKDTAKFLNVHWQTVRNHIKSGKLKSHKIGKNVRIKQSDLDNFLAGSVPQNKEHEIEIRFIAKDRKIIEKNLLNLGAKITYHGHVVDHWFVPKSIKSTKQKDKSYSSAKGFGLRIREQDNGYTGKITTSLEVKRLVSPNDHEACIEHEIAVANYKEAKELLKLMDYKESVTLEKDRLVYLYNGYKIVIDDIKNFKIAVEIEIVTSKEKSKVIPEMRKIARKIGIDLEKDVTDKSATFEYIKKFAKY